MRGDAQNVCFASLLWTPADSTSYAVTGTVPDRVFLCGWWIAARNAAARTRRVAKVAGQYMLGVCVRVWYLALGKPHVAAFKGFVGRAPLRRDAR